MKYIIAALILSLSLMCGNMTASAQYSDVYRKGADLYMNMTKLSEEQISGMLAGMQEYTIEDVHRYRKGFRTGKGLLIGFGSLTGAGLFTLGVSATGMLLEGAAFGIGTMLTVPFQALGGESPDISYESKFRGAAVAGLYAACAGVLGLAAGTAVLCANRNRLDKVADYCNGRTAGMNLAFGACENGFGLKLEF